MAELYTTPLFSDANLQAYYRLEGNSNDSKGSNNGTDTSITYSTSYGKYGQGASLNGSSSKITLPSASALEPTGSFTVAGWVNPTNGAADCGFIETIFQSTVLAGFLVGMTGGNLRCLIGKNTGLTINTDYVDVHGSKTINDGNWHHIAAVWDGTHIILYVDGVQDSSFSNSINPVYNATVYCKIGCQGETGTDAHFLSGDIDDLALFNRGLTATEVMSLYNNSLPFYLNIVNQAIVRASRW